MLDLLKTPFSYRGSYLAVIQWQEGTSRPTVLSGQRGDGIYIKSVRNSARSSSAIARLVPMVGGKEVPVSVEYEYHKLSLSGKGIKVDLCFAEVDRLAIHVVGAGASLAFDFLPVSPYDYAFELADDKGEKYCVLNSYKSQAKFFLSATAPVQLIQTSADDRRGSLEMKTVIAGDDFLVALQEIPTHMNARKPIDFDFDECVAAAKTAFDDYASKFTGIPAGLAAAVKDAVYASWATTVRPCGLLKRDATWMSNTVFPGVWSWDHCFNSLGFMHADPKLAYDNMAVVFDFQDEYGQLPGSVNDSNVHWNFAKPPIQGLFVEKMFDGMKLSEQEALYLYEGIERQVDYWLLYHDCNRDGIPEYHHGNDSGYDNSTVFLDTNVADLPDLTAFLLRALDALEKLAPLAGKDARFATEKKAQLAKRFAEHFVVGGKLVARNTVTQEVIECDSVLPYVALVAAKYLPQEVVANAVADLKRDFLTDVGLATEKPTSTYFKRDGYWRGPVWAPEMVIFIDSLFEIGESEFAEDLVRRFVSAMAHFGYCENYDPFTGAGNDDPSHTWASGSFLYLVQKYAYCLENL